MGKSLITLTLAVLLLTGCAGTGANLESAKKMSPNQSDVFEANLYQNYINLAEVQITQRDLKDRDFFAERATTIARGRHVEPQLVVCRDLSAPDVIELTNARTDLTLAFSYRARLIAAKWVASAQSNYDCWIEEQEDNKYPEVIKQCREGFYMAMQKVQRLYAEDLQRIMVTKPEAEATLVFEERRSAAKVKKAKFTPKNFIIYFGHDKSNLRDDSIGTLQAVLDILKQRPSLKIRLRGHTDRSGSDAYNDRLSMKRSNTIASWFKSKGINAEIANVAYFGEKVPAVQTKDSVRESRNRRVEILLFE